MELGPEDVWTRCGGPESVSARFFQKAVRWNVKPCYVQDTGTEQTTNGKFVGVVWAARVGVCGTNSGLLSN
jgi:hypothetical protein